MERKDHAVVEELAERCAIGWAKMVEELNMETVSTVAGIEGKEVDARKDSTRTSFESSRL
jgi:4-hydroxyphenylpyruvate dioxygenase